MDANQLVEALSRAVEAAKPAAEYCVLAKQEHWWTVCMTKAEWSGWMQAIGSVVALAIAIWLPYKQADGMHKKNWEMAKQCLLQQIALLHGILTIADSRGPREALYQSRELVETLSLAYQEVRISDLPSGSLPSWLSARTTSVQLSSLISGLKDMQGSGDGLVVIVKFYLTNSEKNLTSFMSFARPKKSGWLRPFGH